MNRFKPQNGNHHPKIQSHPRQQFHQLLQTELKTFIKIYQPRQTLFQPLSNQSKTSPRYKINSEDKEYLSSSIQLNRKEPNKLIYHNYSKFNSFQFQFDSIIKDRIDDHVLQEIDLYRSMIELERDCCLIVCGSRQSGLEQFCQNNNNVGLFLSLIDNLFKRMKNHAIMLKFVIISNEKILDILNPKKQVTIIQKNHSISIVGCQTYEVKDAYSYSSKLKQVYQTKKLIHPQSIMIIQGQIIDKGSHQHRDRHFSLIQWQKNVNKTNNNPCNFNNNKTLLSFNMLLYELFKFSIKSRQIMSKVALQQLQSQFRSSHINKIIKRYLSHGNQLSWIGCISTNDSQDQQNFHTLMLMKNLMKIRPQIEEIKYKSLKLKVESFNISRLSVGSEFLSKEHSRAKTLSMDKVIQKQSEQGVQNDNLEHLKTLKQKLKKILNQKNNEEQKSQIQSQMTVNLTNSYKKKPMISSLQALLNDDGLNLPKIKVKTQQKRAQIYHLQKIEQTKLQQLSRLKYAQNIKIEINKHNIDLKNILQKEIESQQKQLLEYVNRKRQFVKTLKNKIKEIPSIDHHHQHKSSHSNEHSTVAYSEQKKRKDIKINHNKSEVFNAQIEPSQQQDREQMHHKIAVIRKMNKGNYLFEKRRRYLKEKITRGRPQVNKFYEIAASKYKQYKYT